MNQTSIALINKYGVSNDVSYNEIIPFSSQTKASGLIYKNGDKLLLGAPEFLIGDKEKVDIRGSPVSVEFSGTDPENNNMIGKYMIDKFLKENVEKLKLSYVPYDDKVSVEANDSADDFQSPVLHKLNFF